ncbi:MAG: tetraacyldisaccharide 4'-kinase [Deltaproteobacteria bacterium]|nr:MAG: tetraacyldisaccharide 4'-kinase [Deltaproteobacteria bacterium]
MTGRIQSAIASVMHSDDPAHAPVLAGFLSAASRLYARAADWQNHGYVSGRRGVRQLPFPVISVGNITVGGTGKTPMTLYLARYLLKRGLRVALLSRGYGGRCSRRGGLVSDGCDVRLSAREAGDEPYLMALSVPGAAVAVHRDRYRAGLIAARAFSPHVAVLDDGFQHRKLHRDLDLVLLDADRPFGNGFLLPRGTLRETPSGLIRSQGLILTRSSGQPLPEGLPPHLPVFRCRHEASVVMHGAAAMPDAFSGQAVLAVSGIAKNAAFQETLDRLGMNRVHTLAFADHHRYTDQTVAEILNAYDAAGAAAIVTTEKDAVKWEGRMPADVPVWTVRVHVQFTDSDPSFSGWLDAQLTKLGL